MDQAQSSPLSQHYLAEIKYPNIPNPIEIDKIFNVLHKIRTTSKPLFYKWQTLNRPKHGEIYLEQKYPVTRDPIAGDQFSIVDDGYLWSSIPKPEIQEHQGQQVEVSKWTEGYSPGDKLFTVFKTEYRLKTLNNVLFLVHYLENKTPSVPTRTALPPTKISPVYLQQQFFQQLKQQMAQMTSIRRSPSPGPPQMTNKQPSTLSKNGNSLQNRSNSASTVLRPQPITNVPNNLNEAIPLNESSIDIFDSFGDFEAAFYRLNILKPLLRRLFEIEIPSSSMQPANTLKREIEIDLISATRKKIFTIENRVEILKKNQKDFLKQFKNDQKRFWTLFNELLNGIDSETDLSISYKLLMGSFEYDMNIEMEDNRVKYDQQDPQDSQKHSQKIYTSL